jgi:hypothetical protein
MKYINKVDNSSIKRPEFMLQIPLRRLPPVVRTAIPQFRKITFVAKGIKIS